MPWDNNTGGGGRNNNGGPWGQVPGGGGGGGNNRRPGNTPNLEDLLARGRNRLQGGVPGGRWAVVGVVLLLLVFWFANSLYTIEPQEVGVESTFGKPSDQLSTQGLHFMWWPVQRVERVVTTQNKTEIGTSSRGSTRTNSGMMLTADQNIVDLKFAVLWTITDPKAYLFNVRDPDDMVRAVGESAMREVIGRSPAEAAFRSNRSGIQSEVVKIMQTILNSYEIGINVDAVTIENVAPPDAVADAFAEVQRAQQDQQNFQEQARSYANTLLGNANGQAAQIREAAAAYKNRVVQEAEGSAARFVSIYNEYVKAPEVTRKRLYFETMEQVLGDSQKVIVEKNAGSGVVPYLPLPELQAKPVTTPPAAAGTTTTTQQGTN